MLEACEIKNASVLIVDDMEANVMLLYEMLRHAGYTNITSTQNPREVLGLHREHRFDLILLDLQMPEMDGFEVIEALKEIETGGYLPDVILMDINLPGISGYDALKILNEDPATAHIPVLALSANAVPRDIEKGLEAGFFRYLTKPIRVREFMDALDVALHHAAEHGPAHPAEPAIILGQEDA